MMPDSLRFSPSPLGYVVSLDPFIKTVTPQKLYALSQEFPAFGECKNFLELILKMEIPGSFPQDSESFV